MIAGLDPTRIKDIGHFRAAETDRGLGRRLPKIHHLRVSDAAIQKLGAGPSAERIKAPLRESHERGVGEYFGLSGPVNRLHGARLGPELRGATAGGAGPAETVYTATEKRLIARIDEPPLTRARETDANMTRRAAEGLKPEILQSELRGRDPTRVRHESRSCRCARQKKSAHSAPDFFTRSRAVAITAEIYAANLARFRPAPSVPR